MTSSNPPLVSIVIPVYNGAAFLADAIRSVLAQTYQHFDLTIVDNRSTDGTRAIAQEFAARDDRIRIHDNEEFLSVVDNHNMAFSLIAPDATYCKALGADDWLFPNYLAELVAVAEAHPTVGMVTSYVLCGSRIGWAGLPYPSTVLPGREVCRLRLLRGLKVFGGPSASLLRASAVREQQPFYEPGNYHGDNIAYLRLLQRHDFGFVHQVLSYNRKGEESRTTAYLTRVNSYVLGDIDELTRFGPVYLTESETALRLRAATREYYRFLARSVVELRGREFWHYHVDHARSMGYALSYGRLARYVGYEVVDLILNPKRTIEGAVRRFGRLPARSRRPGRAAARARTTAH
jgi:glycosyltransferase involved in cell wall biosynthesis